MKTRKQEQLVPHDMISPGFEAVYATERDLNSYGTTQGIKEGFLKVTTDDCGKRIKKWSVWPMTKGPNDWDERIKHINKMQEELGCLDEEIRKLRIQISSLVPCDSGFPVTVDELLKAIGNGKLSEPAFRNGCWMPAGTRGTQPRQVECMKTIYEILTGYLGGNGKEGLIEKYPFAKNFISHTYEWLGPVDELTRIQRLLMERLLLPFDFFTKASHCLPRSACPENAEEACQAVMKNCFEEGGRGPEIDAEIATLADLPKISMKYPDQARKQKVDDPKKMDLYVLCCSLAHGLHTLADCHHSTFRWIEACIYGTGTGKWGIPTRKAGTERQRLGHLLFSYSLGLDKWLSGEPMQFVLLDLGHIDLGFEPKNEILRVYAYLGEEKTAVISHPWTAEFNREMIRCYGTCAILAWQGQKVVGHLWFYPMKVARLLSTSDPHGVIKTTRCREPDEDQTTLFVQCVMSCRPYIGPEPDTVTGRNWPSMEEAGARRGTGLKLVQGLVSWAKEHGWKRIVKQAHADLDCMYGQFGGGGKAFWEKAGFTVIGSHHDECEKADNWKTTVESQAKAKGMSKQEAWTWYHMMYEL